MTTLPERLKAALPAAMKARDKPAVSALRSALAAIDNAAAITPGDHSGLPTVGLASTEAPRREQDEAEYTRIVRTEIDERLQAADEYDRLGLPETAEIKRAEARTLSAHL